MERDDLPRRAGIGEGVLQPLSLLGIGGGSVGFLIVGIDDEDFDVALARTVIALVAGKGEETVVVGRAVVVIVISQRRPEFIAAGRARAVAAVVGRDVIVEIL